MVLMSFIGQTEYTDLEPIHPFDLQTIWFGTIVDPWEEVSLLVIEMAFQLQQGNRQHNRKVDLHLFS